jgi:putative ABC transport system permease protein
MTTLEDIGRDVRAAWRTLLGARAFTLVAITSLGLGLALTASTMAVVNAYLIRSLPYPAAERLYHVVYAMPGQPEPRGMALIDWPSVAAVVDVADSSTPARFHLKAGGNTHEAPGLLVAPGSLESLGVRVGVGRSFRPPDFDRTAEPVALIGPALWRDRFDSDPAVIGRQFRASLNDQDGRTETFRIVGILPSGFRYAGTYSRNVLEIVAPLRIPMRVYLVRLRAGVPVAAAEQVLTGAARRVALSVPPNWNGVRLESVHARYVAGLRPILVAITTAAGLVLLIVCANVAVLLLLRAMRRQKEIGVRVALGAGRVHILRMLLAESVLICGLAAAGGLVVTAVTLRLLAPLIEERLGRPAPGGTAAISIDPTVFLIVGGMGIAIAVTLSLVPVLSPWQRRLGETLRRHGRSGTDGPTMRRVRSSLIAFEVAGSLALLVGCGLMIRSVVNLVRTDLGFQTAHVMRARIVLPARAYPDGPSLLAFYERLTAQLAARSPGLVALANLPAFFEPPKQFLETDSEAVNGLAVSVLAVTADYFAALGIPVTQGRAFTPRDRLGAEPVAIVSDALARRLWPGGRAVGRRLRTAEYPAAGSPLTSWRTVVGVSRDVRQTYVDEDRQDVYIPFFQAPNQYAPLMIRTDQPASFWLPTVRAVIAAIDPEVAIYESPSLQQEADRLVAGTRFLTTLLTGFAIFAALLAVLGIYGVTAYAAQQRERETAIRIALGATRGAVVRMFLGDGALVLVSGIACGLLAAAALTRLLEHQLYGVQRSDPSTLFATGALMMAAGLLATWWPARRAAIRDPLPLLKEE